MLPDRFRAPLKEIVRKLSKDKIGYNIPYAIVGSVNQTLQGMDLNPRDLDLVSHVMDLHMIRSIFSGYNPTEVDKLKPMSADPAWTEKLKNRPAWAFYFDLAGVQVQVFGENQDGDYVNHLLTGRLVQVPFEGLNVPCFTLEAEIKAYESTFRTDKADRIRQFLEK